MKRVVIQDCFLNMSCTEFWNTITDIKNIPLWVKFVTSSENCCPLQEGTVWYDVTEVLWVPLRIRHIVTDFQKEKFLRLQLPLIGGGTMWEEVTIKKQKKGIFVTIKITFDLKWNIANLTIGHILKKRVKYMIDGSMRALQKRIALSGIS